MYFLEHHRDARLDDIAIMVPDLTCYQAYLKLFLILGLKDYLFTLLNDIQGNHAIMGLLQLLELKTNQFSRQSITALIKQPAIAAAFQLNDPETISFVSVYQVHSGYVDED